MRDPCFEIDSSVHRHIVSMLAHSQSVKEEAGALKLEEVQLGMAGPNAAGVSGSDDHDGQRLGSAGDDDGAMSPGRRRKRRLREDRRFGEGGGALYGMSCYNISISV